MKWKKIILPKIFDQVKYHIPLEITWFQSQTRQTDPCIFFQRIYWCVGQERIEVVHFGNIVIYWLWMNAIICLTHWGRVMYKCISKLTIIVSYNGLAPGERQAFIWINDRILLIWTLRTNLNEILSKIHTFSLKKMHLKMSYGKRQPFCLGLNMLIFKSNQTDFQSSWLISMLSNLGPFSVSCLE